MSGHSKWAKIKRQKGVKDNKRGALFTKLARNITMAASEGGGDPNMNFTLRLCIDKAKMANMPLDNIERALKKGTGELQAEVFHHVTYEAITNYGISILIDCATNNTNRTFSELRNIIENSGSKLGASGSVSWQFAEQGLIEVNVAKLKKSEKYGELDKYMPAKEEELELRLLDLPSIIDYEIYDSEEDEPVNKVISIRTEKTEVKKIAEILNNEHWQVIDSSVIKYPSNKIDLAEEQKEKLAKFIDELTDRDDVDEVWHNCANFD